jgi:hypothetical protein
VGNVAVRFDQLELLYSNELRNSMGGKSEKIFQISDGNSERCPVMFYKASPIHQSKALPVIAGSFQ